MLYGVGYFALAHMPRNAANPDSSATPFARWDSAWYISIAQSGYGARTIDGYSDAAFFPLFPLLIAGVYRATGIEAGLAGQVISLACLLAAVPLIAAEAREEGFDADDTLRALFCFPTAFFLLACYTESLFLLTTVASLFALRRRRFAAGSVCGFLAALTRPTGVLVVLPFLWEARDPRVRTRALLAAAGPLAGLGAFAVYLWRRFGNPLAYIEAHRAWHNHLASPWETFAEAWRWKPTHRFDALLTSLFLVLGILLLKRSTGLAIYVLASLAMFIGRGTLDGGSRYVMVLFPAFFLIGEAIRRSRALRWTLAPAGIGLLVFFTARFATDWWIG